MNTISNAEWSCLPDHDWLCGDLATETPGIGTAPRSR